MATGNLLAMLSGAKVVHAGEAFEPGAVLKAVERERVYVAVWRTDDVSPNLPAGFQATGSIVIAHRIIAGASVPMELDAARDAEMHIEQVVIGYG